MQKLHIMNSNQRNASVAISSVRYQNDIQLGVVDDQVTFQRYLQATEAGLDNRLSEDLSGDYAQHLLDADPEIDVEAIGQFIGATDTVFLSSIGEILHAAPQVVEILYDTTANECDRRDPVDVPANVRDESPALWTGRKMPKTEMVRRFALKRTIQLQHLDGLTYDFLYEMASELDKEQVVVLIGGGPKGKDPLVFQTNGTPYRSFLEGRVDGEKYKLLLHLSNMELKRDSGGFVPKFQAVKKN